MGEMPETTEEAMALLGQMSKAAGTIFRALDLNGDGIITAEDINAAPDKRIRELTPEGDTVLDYRLGGPGRIYRVLP